MIRQAVILARANSYDRFMEELDATIKAISKSTHHPLGGLHASFARLLEESAAWNYVVSDGTVAVVKVGPRRVHLTDREKKISMSRHIQITPTINGKQVLVSIQGR